MATLTMKELLEAGVHFGHQTKRWNPKMQKYIFGERNGIYIIDLQKTLKKFREAYAFVRDLAADGGIVLFVGTKKQAQETVLEETTRCGMFYVNHRWLGGTLTNFATIRKSIARLKKLDEMSETGEYERLPKKEVIGLERERAKLQSALVGIKNMDRLPSAVFVIDPNNKVRLTITYPASTGRNFDEILRVIDSLQLTDSYKVATPVNWTDGDDVIVVPAVTDDDADKLFPKGYKAVKPYLRVTPQPNK